MRVRAEPAEYAGVPVTHPSIVKGIERLATEGYDRGHIIRVIGMPAEVVDRVIRNMKRREEKGALGQEDAVETPPSSE